MSNSECRIYNKNCKLADSKMCNKNCWKFIQLNFQYKYSNIPKKYKSIDELTITDSNSCDKKAFVKLNKYKNNIHENVEKCNGAFIWGYNKGNGKTSWSIKILKEYFKQLHNTIETFEKVYGMYINVPTLFKKLRDSFDKEDKSKIRKLEKNLINCNLLVIDDIGTEAPTTWVKESLYIIINQRDMEQKTTIFTSNVSLDELESEDLLGTRIVDRIYSLTNKNIVELQGPSWRRGGLD